MAQTRDFLGKLLISSTDGKNLGQIKDIYLNQDATRMVAVYLGTSGLISRKSLMIEINHISLIGVDACLVDGSDKVIAAEDAGDSERMIKVSELYGREIQTDGGTRIGTIGDVIIDGQCQVMGFSLEKVFVEGPIAEMRTMARTAISSLGDSNKAAIASLEQAEKIKLEAK